MFKYHEVGKILKPYQSKGQLLAEIYDSFSDDILNTKAIFLNIDGINIPFFIETISMVDDLYLIKFEEFSSPEDIKEHNGIILSLRQRDIDWDNKENNISSISQDQFLDYSIVDLNTNAKFIINSIEQFPHQLMAITYPIDDTTKENEVFIPLIEEFIDTINIEDKTITMNLPDGMVTLA